VSGRQRVLFLDCDGVLLDWAGPYLRHIGSQLTINQITDYDFSRQLTDLFSTPQEFYASIDAFEKNLAWGQLPPIVTISHLELLRNAGYELRVLTQAGSGNPVLQTRRIWNLTRAFGAMFASVDFTHRGQSKLEFVSEWDMGHMATHDVFGIVEDKGSTLVEFAKDGRYTPIGLKFEHNRFEQLAYESTSGQIKWCSDMNTAAEYLTMLACDK
jgi:hypothetical protein